MRVPDHVRHRCAGIALAALLATTGAATPPTLAVFDRFELTAVALDADLPAAEGNERVRRQLQMHLRDRLDPWIAERNRRPVRGTLPRTLRIEATILALDPVDPAARLAIGGEAGGTPLRVGVRFVDAASGEVVAETELQAGHPMLVNVASIDAAGAQPRRIAADLVEYLDAAVTSASTPEPRLPH